MRNGMLKSALPLVLLIAGATSVLAEGSERPPDSIAELGVGILTAREIGWAPPVPAQAR